MHAHTRNLSSSSSTAALAHHEVSPSPQYIYSRQRSLPTIRPSYRVTIRLVTASLTVGIGGSLAYTIIIKDSTAESRFLDLQGSNQRAWPQKVWMQPTIVLLTAAGISCLFDLTALIMACAEVHRTELWAVCLGSLAFTVSIAAWIAALVYAKVWRNTDSSSSDLWSWSCGHQSVGLNYGNDSIGFGSLCRYMNFVFCGGIVICALQLVNLVLFWTVRAGERAQKEIAKRNAYARKYILGNQGTASQDH